MYYKFKDYRVPALITDLRMNDNKDVYPLCPRCREIIKHNSNKFCSECGQALDWSLLHNDGTDYSE